MLKNIFDFVKKQRKLLIIIGVIIAIIIGLLIWRATKQASSNNSTTSSVVAVATQDLVETVDVTGTVLAANYVEVQTQAIGTVSQVYVTDGDTVKEGDALFLLELSPEGKEANQAAYSSYLSAKNNLASAENKLNSLQVTLFNKNQYFLNHADAEDLAETDPTYIMQWAEWKAAENDYINQASVITAAKASVTSAYQNYTNTSATVTAPQSGTVENIAAVVGMSFGEAGSDSLSARLATIKTADLALVSFTISASDITKVAIGQSVTLTSSNLDEELVGEIVSVDRYGDSSSLTYTAIAQFEPAAGETLLPNLSVEGSITISEQLQALVVPTLALGKSGTDQIVTIQNDDGSTTTQIVTTGVTADNYTQILTGLTGNEKVVVSLSEFSTSSNQMMGGGGMMMGGNGGGGMPPGGR